MEKAENVVNEHIERRKSKIRPPHIMVLISVLIIVIALFLPYMTATGDLTEYIEKHPDRVEIESLGLTASDLANIPIISVSNIITGVYGEDDGTIANVIVCVLGGFLALTTLFAILKKPIAIMVFDLLSLGVFFFLNFLMKEDFISPDKYAWGCGYYILLIASVVAFAGAIWLLATKIKIKRQTKKIMTANSID